MSKIGSTGKAGRKPTGRGKQGVTRGLLTEGPGVPIGLVIDGTSRHGIELVRPTLHSLVAERPEATEEVPQGLSPDTGRHYDDVWVILEESSSMAHIRARGEGAKALTAAAGTPARRTVVERGHRWVKRSRCILVRWDKRPEHSMVILHGVGASIASRAAGVFG